MSLKIQKNEQKTIEIGGAIFQYKIPTQLAFYRFVVSHSKNGNLLAIQEDDLSFTMKMIEIFLVGWDEITYEDGSPVEFKPENFDLIPVTIWNEFIENVIVPEIGNIAELLQKKEQESKN